MLTGRVSVQYIVFCCRVRYIGDGVELTTVVLLAGIELTDLPRCELLHCSLVCGLYNG